jgi:hypothetical protein
MNRDQFGPVLAQWRPVVTHGDGNCLIHALFQSMSAAYRSWDAATQKRYIQTFRTETAPTLIGAFGPVFTSAEQAELRGTIFLSDDIAVKLARYFQFNLILAVSQTVVRHGRTIQLGNVMAQPPFLEGRPFLAFYLSGASDRANSGSHYESIKFPDGTFELPYKDGLQVIDTYGGIDRSFERIKYLSPPPTHPRLPQLPRPQRKQTNRRTRKRTNRRTRKRTNRRTRKRTTRRKSKCKKYKK